MAILDIPLPEAPPGGFYGGYKAANQLAKSNLENKMQELKNQYYGPNIESEIAQREALTEGYNIFNQYAPDKYRLGNLKTEKELYYMPLEMAIKVSNARVHSNRFNDVGNYLRSFGAMTADQKTAYLADPNNKEFHDQMMREFKEGMNNPQNTIDLLPNEFLQNYFSFLNQQPNKQPTNNISNLPYQQQNNLNQQRWQPYNEINQDIAPGFVPPNQPDFQQMQTPEEQKAPTTASNQQQQLLFNQMSANQKLITTQDRQRLGGAVQIEKYLMDNREKISKALHNANKYSGLIRQGKRGFDQLFKTDPDAYSDLIWFENTFVPTVSNGIRFMEGLSTSIPQREELTNMSNAIGNWKNDPNRAMQITNKQLGTLQDVGDSVIATAEPIYKGVTRKAYNLPRLKEGEDYILPLDQLNQITIMSPGGRMAKGNKKQIDAFLKEHTDWKVVKK